MARPKIEDLTQWQSQTPEDVWAELMRARREEAVLRAVLKPFAEFAQQYPAVSDDVPDSGAVLRWRGDGAEVTIGHFRAALKAMEGE